MRRGALVLCGGRSTRMGRDKASLPFGSEVLLQRAVRRIAPCVDDIVVAARPGQDVPVLPDSVRLTRDAVKDEGPLQGLLGGLQASEADAVFATACDAPFLRTAVVDLLFARLEDHAVAVAVAQGFAHPLCAVYRRDVAQDIAALLEAGKRRPIALYERVSTARIDEHALRTVDPDLESLRNCNRPEDYDTALADFDAWPRVTIELFEMARKLAGVASVRVVARTIREALEELGTHCPALEGAVVRHGIPTEHWRVSRDGKQFASDLDAPLTDRTSLVLVSALAGG